MRNVIAIALFVFAWNAKAQIQLTPLTVDKFPQGIDYKGKLVEAVQWTDKTGTHVVATTEAAKENKTDESRSAELWAYHWLKKNNQYVQVWKIYDFVAPCMTDVTANFLKNTLSVTDLNTDGAAEIWLMYRVCCRGDVSPCDTKIIMYQDKQKFAMRGKSKMIMPENQPYGGEYTFDGSFKTGVKSFRDFAQKLWNTNITETF